jgi:hypothetical protein
MKDLFNFKALKTYLQASGARITVNSLNGLMRPYVKRKLCQELSISKSEYIIAFNCK